MNALEKLHKKLDDSNWDASNNTEINKAFTDVYDELTKNGDFVTAHLSEVDSQAFAFSKTPEKRLSYKVAGDKTMSDGTIIPYEWPDVNTFTSGDFIYLTDRFHAAKNNFAIVEYGLVLYYSAKLKSNEDVHYLLTKLFESAKKYLLYAKEGDKSFAIVYFENALENSLFIASRRKSNQQINEIYKGIIRYIFNVHQEWEKINFLAQRTTLNLTNFAIQYFNDFNATVDLKALINRNWQTAIFLADTYTWGAIYVTDISVRLLKKLKGNTDEWLTFKARQYEKLSVESRAQQNMAAVFFIEKAMRIYKGLKDPENLGRLETLYRELRNEFEMGEVSVDMPQDEQQRIADQIQKVITESNEEGIIRILMGTPMIMPLESIREWSKDFFKEDILENMFAPPTSKKDKFGNTIAKYVTEEERKKIAFIKVYKFYFEIALQTIVRLFMEAFYADKVSAKTIRAFLSNTWYNYETRKVYGKEVPIDNITLIESGINSLFYEISLWKTEQKYTPNFVCATDSLVLKVEFIIREFAAKIGKPTFKPKPKEPEIIMEKLLDELLWDLEDSITEDDLYFIKFILIEKAGYNLRNRVAHGLMDSNEYSIETVLLPLIIILKLGNYQFTNK